MTVILNFISHPDLERSEKIIEKLRNMWQAVKFGIAGYFIFLILFFVDHLLSKLLGYHSSVSDTFAKFNSYFSGLEKEKLFLLGILITPVVEEIAFRGFLNFRKLYIAISAGTFGYIVLRTFLPEVVGEINPRLFTVGVALLLTIVVYFSINNKIHSSLKRNYKLLFYLSNILFVIFHISNYDISEFALSNYLVLPLILMPQAIASLNFSYIRIRNGLLWSILFHSFYNCIFFLPLLLK